MYIKEEILKALETSSIEEVFKGKELLNDRLLILELMKMQIPVMPL